MKMSPRRRKRIGEHAADAKMLEAVVWDTMMTMQPTKRRSVSLLRLSGSLDDACRRDRQLGGKQSLPLSRASVSLKSEQEPGRRELVKLMTWMITNAWQT
jgi:hypothetical protein